MSYRVINSQLICSNYEREYPAIARGEGVYLYDRAGKRYLDSSGCTAAVTALGHGSQEVAEVLAAQAKTLAVHPTHLFHSELFERYLERLCAFSPPGFEHAWTICGGTEAIENAIKLAFQYHRAKGRKTRRRVVARWGSYHGNSLLALDVGGMKARRDFYTDMMVGHLHTSACFPYRRAPELSLEAYEDQLVAEFAELVAAHPDEIVCFVAEPIVGSALGAVEPTPGYFARIAEICRAHDILMIADEIMTGFGRTGLAFGCQHFGTHADILACAKGISGGYFPLGAILAHERIHSVVRASGEPFYSGQTYSCIPLAAAVGEVVLGVIEREGLVENSARVGAHLRAGLESLRALPCVGDVRGRGLFLALEFVAERETKTPYAPELLFAKRVEAAALRHGLVTYAARGTVELERGDHMLFAPPLILTEGQADELVAGLRAALVEVLEGLD